MVSSRIKPIALKQVWLHILFWFVYVLLGGILSGIEDHEYMKGLTSELIMLPLKMALTYYVLQIAVPMFMDDALRVRSIVLTILVLVVAIFVYRVVLLSVIFPTLYPERSGMFWNPRGFLLVAFDLFTAVVAALSVKLTRMYYRSKRRQDELEREKMQSELNYLRAQTNPHYLFNTLNTLYGLALRKDEHTAEAILRLSQIMDFTLHQSQKESVPLEEEVQIVRNIIDLERLRSSKIAQIVVDELVDNPRAMIAPMLLVPFVENAFKHGVATAPEKPFVRIRIEEDMDQLQFSVINNFRVPESQRTSESESLGLSNVQRQLELLYTNAYKLSIEKTEGVHTVSLQLDLSKMQRR
jgi:two-component system, LytTR family, sensor kinase